MAEQTAFNIFLTIALGGLGLLTLGCLIAAIVLWRRGR